MLLQKGRTQQQKKKEQKTSRKIVSDEVQSMGIE